MTRASDIKHAISLGVDAIGLIFYPKSARNLTVDQAKLILQELPPFVDMVAVFVNSCSSFIRHVITELPIQLLQFHGDESATFCEQFSLPYIKAIPATSTGAITAAVAGYPRAAAILLDTPSITSHGGTGVSFDWQMIPQHLAKPIILAGGLDAFNVCTAIAACAPYAVDICSGVEASAGVKDHDKMRVFVDKIGEKNERARAS